MNVFEAVKAFHRAFDQPVNNKPFLPGKDERELRYKLMVEEFKEYTDAEEQNDIVEIADALADMIYIICGTAASYGIPLEAVFSEVHDSNMAKLGPDGKPIKREDGKIIKPEGWQPPDVVGVLAHQLENVLLQEEFLKETTED